MATSRKKHFETVDGTPEKRLFLSIISDYDLKTGICELVDNAIDLWTTNDRQPALAVRIDIDVDRQLIRVADNAGGVKETDLRLLIAPGASRSDPSQELIGIFGVGGKRAAVALGEHVEIRTRHKNGKSLQLEITNDWLGADDWHIDAFQIADIDPGSTVVDISKLRQGVTDVGVQELAQHLAETYSWFLKTNGFSLTLNGNPIKPIVFDLWAYPPDFRPRRSTFTIDPAGKGELRVTLRAGLIRDRNPETENYGVYFYCNHRLIVKELRSREVGYITGEAGVPHPDASLCRVLIDLDGPAELMPWNSSKNGLNFSHPALIALRSQIIWLTSYFTSLSRRLKNDWDDEVFAHPRGTYEDIPAGEMTSGRKFTLPKLPSNRQPAHIDQLRILNKTTMAKKPWTIGLIEAMGILDVIEKQNIQTKNRIALVILDSNFEISLKEFIVSRKDLFPVTQYNDAAIAQLFKSRHNVIQTVTSKVTLPASLLAKVSYYYLLRNKLIHERATVGITDAQIADYKQVIERVLTKLFGIKFPRG